MIDPDADLTTVNTYKPPEIRVNPKLPVMDPYISVDLNVQNRQQYLDDWLDVRLYTSEREESPVITCMRLKIISIWVCMPVTPAGFHHIQLTVGEELRSDCLHRMQGRMGYHNSGMRLH